MLIPEENLSRFREFHAGGGLIEAANLTTGKALLAITLSHLARYSATISEEVDYSGGGIGGLSSAINTLIGELGASQSALESWNEYLEESTEPTDLEQVAQGAEVKRQLDGTDQNEVWPSILPITSKTELQHLSDTLGLIGAPLDELETLMTEVNDVLTPVTVEGTGGEGASTSVGSLSTDQKTRCAAMATTLTGIAGGVGNAAAEVANMIAVAIPAKAEAIRYFEIAVAFTVADGQLDKGSIGDATREVFTV